MSLQCAQPGSRSSGALSSELSKRSTGGLRNAETGSPRVEDASEQSRWETHVPRSSQGYAELLRRQPGLAFLLAAQALSVFNDNAYKTILIFYALSHASSPAELAWMIPTAGGLLVIPYILFSSYAGQVADRFSKRSVIVTMKALEILLMTLATLAVFSGHIGVMMAVLFIEGTHSTFLSPAKEGILPQMLPDAELSRANGLMQLTVYSMIVAGPVAAGFLVPAFRATPYVPPAFLILIALGSFLLSFGITRVPPCGYQESIHWNAAADFWRNFAEIRASRPLFLTVLGIAYFWMLGAIYLMNVYRYGPELLHLDEHGVTYLNACLSIGIGLGAAIAGKLSGDQVELGLPPIGSIGLGLFAIYLFFAKHSFPQALLGHGLLGICGGIFIVPLEAFLQQRAGEQSKGRVIAASNVLTFTAVVVGSGVLGLLSGPLRLRPDKVLLVMGLASFAATAYILTILPDFMVRLCLWLLTHTFYRIDLRNIENLPRRGGALLVCNHVSFIDPFLIGACTQRFVRYLMYRKFYESTGIHWLAKLMGAIPVSENDPPQQIVESLRTARQRLNEGELVCIFAEGAVTRTGNLLRFRSGLERIMKGTSVPIIPVHLDRVWGSIFSYSRGRFFFKWPRRIPYPVTVTFGEPLPASAGAFEVRQAVMALSAEAFAHRDAHQRPLPELFIDTARRNWRRRSMADSFGRELTFGKALAGAIVFRGLVEKHCPGEKTVGVMLPPMVPSALLNVGISVTGRVPVNLNYTAGAEAMKLAIDQAGIKTIFTSAKLLERLGIEKQPGMILVEDLAAQASGLTKAAYLLAARILPRPVLRRWLLSPDLELDGLATIIFSSGSTGVPKGVMLTHRNIVSNVEGMQQALNVDRHDCLLGVLPFFHSFGFSAGLWLPLAAGIGVAFHTNPLEARKCGEMCRKYGVTLLIATPTFAWEYVRKFKPEDLHALRVAIVGAEKKKPELAEAFQQEFGVPLFEGYGATELSPVVAVETPGYQGRGHSQPGSKQGTVGCPIPGVAARIVNPETFEPLGVDKEGMLLIKGPNVMMGYLGQPEKTREVIRDGWYVTGDIAKLDQDGFITITDRLGRFSKIAGEMVPHLRVEEALQKALGTAEPQLVVTSVADEQRGEKLVVLHTGLRIPVDELLKRLREAELPKLWLPRKENFFRIEALPLLGTGKLDLRCVRDTARRLTDAACTAKPAATEAGV
jgi:acyl-[acyl-carrier-protein]-phospholipid O-acyltransferase / long-chain-fatty-acid--[acyl-carrier-protein] ligase